MNSLKLIFLINKKQQTINGNKKVCNDFESSQRPHNILLLIDWSFNFTLHTPNCVHATNIWFTNTEMNFLRKLTGIQSELCWDTNSKIWPINIRNSHFSTFELQPSLKKSLVFLFFVPLFRISLNYRIFHRNYYNFFDKRKLRDAPNKMNSLFTLFSKLNWHK